MRALLRPVGPAILLAATAVGLSACGSAPADAPHVASLGASSTTGHRNHGGTTTTTGPKGNATALVDEWAACMRTHGDPGQTDPTIDAYGVINITIPNDAGELSNEVHAGADPCNQYMAAASAALEAADPVAPPPDQAQQIKYVECMRTHGVPKYPFPTGDSTNFNGTGVDPNSPFVVHANDICGKQIGAPAWWIAGTGPPGDVTVTSGPVGGLPPVRGAQVPARGGGSGAERVPGTHG